MTTGVGHERKPSWTDSSPPVMTRICSGNYSNVCSMRLISAPTPVSEASSPRIVLA